MATALASQYSRSTADARLEGSFLLFAALLLIKDSLEAHLLIQELLALAEEGEMFENRIGFSLVTNDEDSIYADYTKSAALHEVCFIIVGDVANDHFVDCD